MSLTHRVAGDIALDLANTVSWRGTDRETDHLMSTEDILAWAKETGLIDSSYDVAAHERDVLVKRTLMLRSAISEAGAAIAQGKNAPASALNVIRDLAASALQAAEVSGVPATFKFKGIDKIVGTVAEVKALIDQFERARLAASVPLYDPRRPATIGDIHAALDAFHVRNRRALMAGAIR